MHQIIDSSEHRSDLTLADPLPEAASSHLKTFDMVPVSQNREKHQKRPITIAVWGPTGSPGKSTIAINLAEALSRQGRRVLLLDADIINPSLALMLGFEANSHSLSTLLALAQEQSSPNKIAELVTPVVSRLDLVAGVGSATRWNEITPQALQVLMERVTDYDAVVLDLASEILPDNPNPLKPTRSSLTRFLLQAVDRLVVVGRPDLIGVQRLAESLIELRKLRKSGQVHLVFNQVTKDTSVGAALDAFELLSRERIGSLISRDQRSVASALSKGQTVSRVRRSAKFLNEIDAIVRAVLTP